MKIKYAERMQNKINYKLYTKISLIIIRLVSSFIVHTISILVL